MVFIVSLDIHRNYDEMMIILFSISNSGLVSVSQKSNEKQKSSLYNSNEAEKESREPDYDKDVDQLEEEQEEETTEEITATTNQIF